MGLIDQRRGVDPVRNASGSCEAVTRGPRKSSLRAGDAFVICSTMANRLVAAQAGAWE